MSRRVIKQETEQVQACPIPEIDLRHVAEVLEEVDPRTGLITVLQRLQAIYGFLPEQVVDEVSRRSGVAASRIYGIVTFYAQFTTEPKGRHIIHVCHGTACHVAGATRVTEALEQELGVADGCTTIDMEFTLGSVACMGACSQAPVMRIDSDTFGNLSADGARKVIRKMMKETQAGEEDALVTPVGGKGADDE